LFGPTGRALSPYWAKIFCNRFGAPGKKKKQKKKTPQNGEGGKKPPGRRKPLILFKLFGLGLIGGGGRGTRIFGDLPGFVKKKHPGGGEKGGALGGEKKPRKKQRAFFPPTRGTLSKTNPVLELGRGIGGAAVSGFQSGGQVAEIFFQGETYSGVSEPPNGGQW